jgi:hypothetical protein
MNQIHTFNKLLEQTDFVNTYFAAQQVFWLYKPQSAFNRGSREFLELKIKQLLTAQ